MDILRTKPDRLISGERINDLRSKLLVYMHNKSLSSRDVARKIGVPVSDIEVLTINKKGVNPKVDTALRDLLETPESDKAAATNPQDLGQALKAAGYTPTTMAKAIGISLSCMWNWITCKACPNPNFKKVLQSLLAKEGVELKDSWLKAKRIYKSLDVVEDLLPQAAPNPDLRIRLKGFLEFMAIDVDEFSRSAGEPSAAVKFFLEGGNIPVDRMSSIQTYLESMGKA
jgi:predicted transcriptional regulator